MQLRPKTPPSLVYVVVDHIGLRGVFATRVEADVRAAAVGGVIVEYEVVGSRGRKR